MALGVRLAACSVSLVCPRTRRERGAQLIRALASTTPRAPGRSKRVTVTSGPCWRHVARAAGFLFCPGGCLELASGALPAAVAARAPASKATSRPCVQLLVDLGQCGLTRQRHHARHAAAAVLDLQPALSACRSPAAAWPELHAAAAAAGAAAGVATGAAAGATGAAATGAAATGAAKAAGATAVAAGAVGAAGSAGAGATSSATSSAPPAANWGSRLSMRPRRYRAGCARRRRAPRRRRALRRRPASRAAGPGPKCAQAGHCRRGCGPVH